MTLMKVIGIILAGLFLAGTLAIVLFSDRLINNDSKKKKK